MENVIYDTEIAEMETEISLESIPDSTELETDEIYNPENSLDTESILYVNEDVVNNQSADIVTCLIVIIVVIGVLCGTILGQILWGCLKR